MSRTDSRARRISALKRKKSVSSLVDFETLLRECPDRLRIVSEGDSWFDYPRKLFGKAPMNIIDHIEVKTKGVANVLRLESNGDEIVQMLAYKQRQKLTKLLNKYQLKGKPIDLLFFSGGGNDIVGDWDFERFLLPFQRGFSAEDCINRVAFNVKLKQIEMAFRELINIRDQYSPDTIIVTHTYDIPFVTGKPARYLGINVGGPWLTPGFIARDVPPNMRRAVVRIMLGDLGRIMTDLETELGAAGRFCAARTQGTLVSEDEWLNEIHPRKDGFGLVAEKVYAKAKAAEPDLP